MVKSHWFWASGPRFESGRGYFSYKMIIKENKLTPEIIKRLKKEIFIYPTDTIYGIGCNATNTQLIRKIRKIKQRDEKPFSIIAPSKKWVLENFKVNEDLIDKYLPGPYTLLLEKKDINFLKEISNNKFVGVRIPDNTFTKILQELEIPIITTSVNLSGETFANSVKEINPIISKKVGIIIDSGILSGKPSILIKEGKEKRR